MKTSIVKDGTIDVLRIEIPLQEPAPSTSGKTLIVATSAGIKQTDAKVNGKSIKVGLNAFIDR